MNHKKFNFSNPPIFQIFCFCILLCPNLQSQHISEFVSLGGGTQTKDYEYPESHTFQYLIEENDSLTGGGVALGNFDFTGYVPISGSSTNGYLSINHELTPGGTTILDIQFDPAIQSWEYSASEAISLLFWNSYPLGNNCVFRRNYIG